jgi:hypothetical protein
MQCDQLQEHDTLSGNASPLLVATRNVETLELQSGADNRRLEPLALEVTSADLSSSFNQHDSLSQEDAPVSTFVAVRGAPGAASEASTLTGTEATIRRHDITANVASDTDITASAAGLIETSDRGSVAREVVQVGLGAQLPTTGRQQVLRADSSYWESAGTGRTIGTPESDSPAHATAGDAESNQSDSAVFGDGQQQLARRSTRERTPAAIQFVPNDSRPPTNGSKPKKKIRVQAPASTSTTASHNSRNAGASRSILLTTQPESESDSDANVDYTSISRPLFYESTPAGSNSGCKPKLTPKPPDGEDTPAAYEVLFHEGDEDTRG